MDVRFYPAAAGDPAGLDFAQCLGYYGYSKVTGPGAGATSPSRARPSSRLACCTFFLIFPSHPLASRCALVSDQLFSSSLYVPFLPTFLSLCWRSLCPPGPLPRSP